MSHKLPVLSGREVIRALMKLGYYVRDRESSHVHLRHPAKNPLTVPDHKEVAEVHYAPLFVRQIYPSKNLWI